MTYEEEDTDYMQPRVFDGETFDMKRDGKRLTSQLDRVRNYMLDRGWFKLDVVCAAVNGPGASISARIRDLRKEKFGGYTVDRRHLGFGVYEYRVATPELPKQQEFNFESPESSRDDIEVTKIHYDKEKVRESIEQAKNNAPLRAGWKDKKA